MDAHTACEMAYKNGHSKGLEDSLSIMDDVMAATKLLEIQEVAEAFRIIKDRIEEKHDYRR